MIFLVIHGTPVSPSFVKRLNLTCIVTLT